MFYIQISNPRVLKSPESAEEISDALESIFSMHSEYALIFIEGCVFPLSYKYDLGIMIPDLIDMIQWVLDSEGGSCSIQFGSNTFAYAWTIEKIGDMLKVDVDDEVAAIQGSPILDDRCKHFEVSSDEFLAEWKSLLEKILSTVEESEVKIDNPSQTETIKRLIGRIGVSGIMYR